MKNEKETLQTIFTQEQLEILNYALNKFNIDEFIKDNPQIEEEGSITFYEDNLINIGEVFYFLCNKPQY
jgi:hypothetical protein